MKRILQTMVAVSLIAVTIQMTFITLYVLGMHQPITRIANQILGITWY
jgi:hypothetical protein